LGLLEPESADLYGLEYGVCERLQRALLAVEEVDLVSDLVDVVALIL
jgi:hypothetical protein